MSIWFIMQPIHKKYLTIIAVTWGCSLVVLSALYIGLLSPRKDVFKFMEGELAEKKLEYTRSKAAGDEKVRAQWNQELMQLKDKLGSFVADIDDLDSLVFGISKVAGKINVDSFSSRGTGGELYSIIPNYDRIGYTEIAINFNCTFTKFARFINALERYRPVIFIDEYSISQSSGDLLGHRVNMLLNVLVKIPPEPEPEDEFTANDS